MFLQEDCFYEGAGGMSGGVTKLIVQQYLSQMGTTECFGQRVLDASSLPWEDVSMCQFPSFAPSC